MVGDSKSPRLFLNHRKEDAQAVVVSLLDALEHALAPGQVFVDEHISAGDRWRDELRAQLERCSVFLCVIGERWLRVQNQASGVRRLDEDDDWVRFEIEQALAQADNGDVLLVPLLLDDEELPKAEYLPPSIRGLNSYQARRLRTKSQDDWRADVKALVGLLVGEGFRTQAQSAPSAPSVPALRGNEVTRDALLHGVLSRLTGAARDQGAPTIVSLYGPGGFGKTTLARVACHQPEVQAAFDGILWATVGQLPDLSVVLGGLIESLTGRRVDEPDVDKAALQLSAALEAGRFLLVLDDVWHAAHLRPFLQVFGDGALLVTTRVLSVAAEGDSVAVREMTTDEALAIMRSRLRPAPSAAQTEALRAVVKQLGEWPLLIELAAATLRVQMMQQATFDGALAHLEQALDREGPEAFDKVSPWPEEGDADRDDAARHQAVARTLAVSIRLLESQDRERYFELSILPEDEHVPLQVAAEIWGLEPYEAEAALQRMADLSLLFVDLGTKTMWLHDKLRSYAARHLGDASPVHARLADHWGDPFDLPHAYAWRFIGYHLVRAGRTATLRELLLQINWLEGKLERVGVAELMADLRAVSDTSVAQVAKAVRQAASVLADDREQLRPQLVARLHGSQDPDIAALLAQAEQLEERAVLMPMSRSLGGPLLQTLRSVSEGVLAVGADVDARILSVITYQRAMRFSLDTSAQLSETRFEEGVAGAALTADGRIGILAVGLRDIELMRFSTPTSRTTLAKARAPVAAVTIARDAGRVAWAANMTTLVSWDASSGEPLNRTVWDLSEEVSMAPTERGVMLFVDDHLVVTDADLNELQRTEVPNADSMLEIAFARDGAHAVVSDFVNLQVLELDAEFKTHDLDIGEYVETFWLSPDGRELLGVTTDGDLQRWDIEKNAKTATWRGISPTLVSGDWSHWVEIDDEQQRCRVRRLESTDAADHVVFDCKIDEQTEPLALSGDGRRLLLRRHGELTVWDTVSGQRCCTLRQPRLDDSQHASQTTEARCTFTADGNSIVGIVQSAQLTVAQTAGRSSVGTVLEGMVAAELAVLTTEPVLLCRRDDGGGIAWNWDEDEIVELSSSTEDIARLELANGERGLLTLGDDREPLEVDLYATPPADLDESYSSGFDDVVMEMPDGQHRIAADGFGEMSVWAGAERLAPLVGHTRAITAFAVTPDAKRLITAAEDHTIRVWDLANSLETSQLPVHGGGQLSLVLADGFVGQVTTLSFNRVKRTTVWSEDGEEVQPVDTGPVAFARDRSFYVVGNISHSLLAWDAVTGEVLGEAVRPLVPPEPSADDNRAGPTGNDEPVADADRLDVDADIDEPDTGTEPDEGQTAENELVVLQTESGKQTARYTGHGEHEPTMVSVLADGVTVASAADRDSNIHIWSLATGESVRQLGEPGEPGEQLSVLAASPVGPLLAAGAADGTVSIWDTATGEKQRVLQEHTNSISALVWSDDGQLLVSGSYDGTARVWDAAGQCTAVLGGHTGGVSCVAINPAQTLCVSGSVDHSVRVWDLHAGELVCAFHGDGPIAVCGVAGVGEHIVAGEVSGRLHFLALWSLYSAHRLVYTRHSVDDARRLAERAMVLFDRFDAAEGPAQVKFYLSARALELDDSRLALDAAVECLSYVRNSDDQAFRDWVLSLLVATRDSLLDKDVDVSELDRALVEVSAQRADAGDDAAKDV